MGFVDELISKLEPYFQQLSEERIEAKVNPDDPYSSGEFVIDAFNRVIDSLIEEVQKANDTVNPSDESTEQNTSTTESNENKTTLNSIKADTVKILGTVTKMYEDQEALLNSNASAVDNLTKTYVKDSEVKSKEVAKLSDDVKKSKKEESKFRKTIRRIGQFLLFGGILFVFGDLIKKLFVKFVDGFKDSKLASVIRDFLTDFFPSLAPKLHNLSVWWEERAKPWLENPEHSFVRWFSNIENWLRSLYNIVVRISNTLGIGEFKPTESAKDDLSSLRWQAGIKDLRGDKTITIPKWDPNKWEGIVPQEQLKALLSVYPEDVVAKIVATEERYKEKGVTRNFSRDPLSGAELLQTPNDLYLNVYDPTQQESFMASDRRVRKFIRSKDDDYEEQYRQGYQEFIDYAPRYQDTVEGGLFDGTRKLTPGAETEESQKKGQEAMSLRQSNIISNITNNVYVSQTSPEVVH